MNAQELKNSILQLAIQGKLVEQREEEGTAKELLDQINEEKLNMIKEKKIKKHKKLLDITTKEIPFDIPVNWEWVRHNNLLEIIGGSQPPKAFFSDVKKDGYIRLYQIRDYGSKPVPVYVPKDKVSKFTNKGDVLLARYGASVGKVFIAEEGAYNVAMAKSHRLFTSSELIDSKYMYYYYLAPLYQSLVRQNSRSAQAGFNKDDLDSLLFPLPPIREQKRIVAKIEELLPYIEQYNKAYLEVEKLNKKFPEDMQKSILQYAIQGKLVEQREEEGAAEELYQEIQEEKKRLIEEGKIKKTKALPEISEDEIPFNVPESWKWVSIGQTCANVMYGTSKKSSKSGEVPVLRMGNLQNGKIDYNNLVYTSDKKEVEKYKLEENDLLFNRTNSQELVGKTAIYKKEQPAIFAGYLVKFTPILVNSDYLNYVMQSDYYWRYCQTVRSDAIGQSNINAEKLKRFIFPLPPLNEQKRIVRKIEEILLYAQQLKS
ncbi:hypothetical protein JMA_26790 [Jeotgalibacillus malaysiensis]|uniref:Type I restriction modification DNA specificity domain-containing protein n=1 Tax=Jeotgalibacillus malaysiensis TaxID=1508404 RepID=A0A0B5APG9_9BACL|nr:restriction endonuclease subunit S [Jeotgalibacillus malaysiensis]AJD91996.1 hypothetical protein JMA_26790 [Jeotgalibacillus malaysiensis]